MNFVLSNGEMDQIIKDNILKLTPDICSKLNQLKEKFYNLLYEFDEKNNLIKVFSANYKSNEETLYTSIKIDQEEYQNVKKFTNLSLIM